MRFLKVFLWFSLLFSTEAFAQAENGTYPRVVRAFASIDNGCWFCGIFGKLFDGVNTISSILSSALREDLIKLLGLAILFFILFKVLKAVISFSEINPKEFLTGLFMPLLKAMFAVIILVNISEFYHYVVNPLTELSIGFATNIQDSSSSFLPQSNLMPSFLTMAL